MKHQSICARKDKKLYTDVTLSAPLHSIVMIRNDQKLKHIEVYKQNIIYNHTLIVHLAESA